MTTYRVTFGVLATACLAPAQSLFSQTASERPHSPVVQMQASDVRPAVTPIHTQDADPDGGVYGIWAAGADYKVSFHNGATVIPYLGRDYPQNQPLRWETTTVSVGSQNLMTHERVGVRRSDTRYEYDHGAVTEVYDVKLEGVEQSFVIRQTPVAAGDLVVRGAIHSNLSAVPSVTQPGAWTFVDDEGFKILDYGSATAIDAAGRRLALQSTFDAGHMELRVPANWLADASFPLVVDPLIGPTILDTSALFNGSSRYFDVLHDLVRTTQNVWICNTRFASATDEDLWLRRTNEDFGSLLVVQAYSDLSTSWSTRTCQLAQVDERVVCAFTRHFSTTTNVRWHTHHVNNLGFQNGVGFWTGSNNNWRVDVGGASATFADEACLVYQHEPGATFGSSPTSEVRGFRLDFVGAGTVSQGTPSAEFVVSATAQLDQERPCVVRDGGAGVGFLPVWLVTHQIYHNGITNDDWDVVVKAVDHTGAVVDSIFVEPNNGAHKLGPVIAGTNGRYLVSYATADTSVVNFKTTTITGYQMETVRLDLTGATLSQPVSRRVILTSAQRDIETSGLGYDTETRDHWMLAWRHGDVIWADLLGYRGATTTYAAIASTSGTGFPYGASVVYDKRNGNHIIVSSLNILGQHPLRGHLWQNPVLPPPTVNGTTCSSATPGWQRPLDVFGATWGDAFQRVGSNSGGFRITGAPSNTLAFFALSSQTANSLLPAPLFGAGCRKLVSTNPSAFLGLSGVALTDSAGTVFWPIALPEGLAPGLLVFQGFHLDTAGVSFESTRRVSVDIDF